MLSTEFQDQLADIHMHRATWATGCGTTPKCDHWKSHTGWMVTSQTRRNVGNTKETMVSGTARIFLCDDCSNVLLALVQVGGSLGAKKQSDQDIPTIVFEGRDY